MELHVYKGFDFDFYNNIQEEKLLDIDLKKKFDIFLFDDKLKKKLSSAVIAMDDDEIRWITYEEFTFIKSSVDNCIDDYGLVVKIINNNIYPDYYPLNIEISNENYEKIYETLNPETDKILKENDVESFINFYSAIINIDEKYYVSYYNYEKAEDSKYDTVQYYNNLYNKDNSIIKNSFDIFITDDVVAYLNGLNSIVKSSLKNVTYGVNNSEVSKKYEQSFIAYCNKNNIKIKKITQELNNVERDNSELIDIAKNVIKIPNFVNFRDLKFYKNPELNNEIIEISQAKIIWDIIDQAEHATKENEVHYRDIFITSPTGAGKSVMFQIPAIYLAQKHKKLTIVIEPVKALMADQKEQLLKRGFTRVETFNSDLITQVEKEEVLRKIKNGEVDLLYISPETLLSYSLETIIGDREVGLFIIDEAHIVTTWGVGFRPDYWYLGGFLNKLRNGGSRYKNQKKYNFPICAFTATATNGGIDDTVSETVISLYMETPIKYIGYAKRDNIEFDINVKSNSKLKRSEYETQKAEILYKRIEQWQKNNEKTIVYFPYATTANEAHKGLKSFSINSAEKSTISLHTGRNIQDNSTEVFNKQKSLDTMKFKSGENNIMFATKAFGMGIDIDDIKNVYHYAITGNLSDYVQEIGRAARKKNMTGKAIIDTYENDLDYMQSLFGMSQIRPFQIKKVLTGIYDTYRIKNNRNFLISPEAFTYIFTSNKLNDKDKENSAINKLKTSLLMIEKDFFDKNNFKVLISRPRSVFTKAYVVINKENEEYVLSSKYGKYFTRIESGRKSVLEKDRYNNDIYYSDVGDVFVVNLKEIWENFYQNISFPYFKHSYFQKNNTQNTTIIMPEIMNFLYPRQKINIETKNNLLLSELKLKIKEDIIYFRNLISSKFRNIQFSVSDFEKELAVKYGQAKSKIIANSLFSIIDPQQTCIKVKKTDDLLNPKYYVSNGRYSDLFEKWINKSTLLNKFINNNNTRFSKYMSLLGDNAQKDAIALKLLSIYDYISYDIMGGEQPEIFIRLNDPEKIRKIVYGITPYSNSYVIKAKEKHNRDFLVLHKFFYDLKNDEDRWDYIERYFLGHNVLDDSQECDEIQEASLECVLDINGSYPTPAEVKNFNDLLSYFEGYDEILKLLDNNKIALPDYLYPKFKNQFSDGHMLMAWSKKNVIITENTVDDNSLELYKNKGWVSYKISKIKYDELKEIVK